MKKVWQSGLSRSLAVFFLLFFYSNSSWAAHIGALEYNMTIGFEVGKNTLSGEADFDLPAGYGLELTVAGLADLSLRVNGARLEAEPDKKGVLFIPTGDNKRKIFLSWKKKVEEDDCSLLSPEGITLLDTWYPRPSVDAEYQLTALVPKQFSAVSEADRIVIEQKGEQKLVTFHFPHPVSRIHFIAGPYKVVEEEFGDGKILASYFFEEDRELAAGFRQKTHQYLARYIRLFGAYPYGRFAIVENRRPTGFAMPTFTLLGQRVVHLPFIIDSSLGHEVLHSWLGNALRSDPQQGNWVEGLTTYLADHAYAAEKGEGSDFRKNQLVKYQNYLADNSTFTVQGFTSAGSHALADKAVRAVGYNKCAMIFHMLHRRVGEDDFREALRLFYQNNRYGRAGWQEIEETFSAVSGLDLSSFFEQWLTRSDVPVLGIKNLDFRETGGDPFLSFDIVQENSKPYDLVVPVRIDTEAGTVNRSVKMEEGRVSVSLELPGYPVQLVVDGHYDLMRSLVDGELPPVWSAFLGARNKLAVIEEGTKEIYAPMIEMIRGIGGRVIEDKELNAGEMEDNSLLFLGEDSDACRSVFGKVDLPGKGFSLEARKNPLNFEEVAVIVQAADRQEVQAVAEKLRHYGKYGRLYFREGRNIKKAIPESDKGIVRNLDKKPTGIALSKRRDFDDLMEKMAENRVIYVGETHVRPVDHQLQMRIVRALYERHPEMAVGMEMFPASVQETLDRYIRAETGEREFLKEVDYFQNWGYDYRYYQDIMQFARKYGIPVLGLNLEKKIVSDAFRRGGI
ncbi:MAG: ChaN family lipoprotein, partial [Thermodesulfobacteriota bacterium]